MLLPPTLINSPLSVALETVNVSELKVWPLSLVLALTPLNRSIEPAIPPINTGLLPVALSVGAVPALAVVASTLTTLTVLLPALSLATTYTSYAVLAARPAKVKLKLNGEEPSTWLPEAVALLPVAVCPAITCVAVGALAPSATTT